VRNGWTGGQYSLFRAFLGAWLLFRYGALLPHAGELFSNRGVLPDGAASPLLSLFPNLFALADSPAVVCALVSLAAGASVFFAIGKFDRTAAVLLWYAGACLQGRNPLAFDRGASFVGWILLAHALLPPAPFGSQARRGRADPGMDWRFPPTLLAAAWVVLAATHAFAGIAELRSPSWTDGTVLERLLGGPLARPGVVREALLDLPRPLLRGASLACLAVDLAFAPLACFRKARPWIWAAGLVKEILLGICGTEDLSFRISHLFFFDPGWIRAKAAVAPDRVFFDGSCGLCHRFVRFALAEDARGERFRFSPLESEAFRAAVPPERRPGLPDSLVLLAADGTLLTKSRAVLHLASRLGGVWRILAGAARLAPAPLSDLAYDGVARVRRRLFRTPEQSCPIVPPKLRDRFDL
jgi:predicted DCC family thiol-disulfide oxidoreductase YuxK